MTSPCRNCGAALIENTRFCRRCGAPSDPAASAYVTESDGTPAEQGRQTSGLPPDDAYRAGSQTTRVNRADLDALLRQSSPARPSGSYASSPLTRREDDAGHTSDQDSARPPDFYETIAAAPDASPAVPPPMVDAGEAEQPGRAASTPDMFVTHVGTSRGHEDDDELTVVAAARTASPAAGAPPAIMSTPAAAPPPAPKSGARTVWLAVAVAGALFLGVLVVGAWLAFDYLRRPVQVAGTGEPSPIPVADPKQLFDEKVAEAEARLAAGELDQAIASLREANRLDPANTRARWRLADLFLETGRRREAIEEYRALTRNDPQDRAAWRALASAQLAENAYGDAAESYRRLLDAGGEAARDANDLLAYADALRLAGRGDEARVVYQELASSTVGDAANAARLRLAELAAQLPPSGAINQPTAPPAGVRPPDADRGEVAAVNAVPVATPTPAPAATPTPAPPAPGAAPAPAERFNRAVGLWPSDRAAAVAEFRAAANGGHADAYYYLGLNIAEGRDPGTLKRAELVAAMSYFQSARRGRFGAQAQRYEAQLGKEYDRRKKE